VALSQSALASALKDVFDAQGSASVAADGLAAAYADYAATGMFGTSVPAITGEAALAATILSAIQTPSAGSPATFGTAWASGLATFWTGVAVAGGSGAGTTAGCPGAAAVGAAIAAVVAVLTNTTTIAANGIAAVLHTATLTVTAALTIPPNPPVVYPIT